MNDLHLRYVKPGWYIGTASHGKNNAAWFGSLYSIKRRYEKWRNKQATQIYDEAADHKAFLEKSFITPESAA